ncbi:MAG: hypothetical protein AABX04_03970 [Nanoarchaeota archaeon]
MDKKYKLDLAEFLGWHVGDGCISITSRYSEYALTGDLSEELLFYEEIVVPTFNKIFNKHLKKNISLKKYKSTGVCGIYVFDHKFIQFLQKSCDLRSGKKINISIPKVIHSLEEKKRFLRGLFDTDGSIYFCNSLVKTKGDSLYTIFHYKPKIKLATISEILIRQVKETLLSLGYSPRSYSPMKQRECDNYIYSVVLDINKDVIRWIKEIGFKNPKHKTKIELWEKFGFCPPKTTIAQRFMILDKKLNPLSFYTNGNNIPLDEIKKRLPLRIR